MDRISKSGWIEFSKADGRTRARALPWTRRKARVTAAARAARCGPPSPRARAAMAALVRNPALAPTLSALPPSTLLSVPRRAAWAAVGTTPVPSARCHSVPHRCPSSGGVSSAMLSSVCLSVPVSKVVFASLRRHEARLHGEEERHDTGADPRSLNLTQGHVTQALTLDQSLGPLDQSLIPSINHSYQTNIDEPL